MYYKFDKLKKPHYNDPIQASNYGLAAEENYILNQSPFKHLSELISDADKNGYEGIMLRKDCGYQGKRTKNLLKCKQFHDAEYKVIDLDFDTNRVIVDGKEVEEMMLRNVIIEHKGNKVSVGSGFSHEEKRYYYENPSKLLNK